MVIISESHLAIHTWPELGYAAVDVFTCGDEVDPWDAYNYIVSAFGADKVTATEVKRGIFSCCRRVLECLLTTPPRGEGGFYFAGNKGRGSYSQEDLMLRNITLY